MIQPVPLPLAEDETRFGGKAVNLGRSLRSGLPVPPGFALDVDGVDALAAASGNTDPLDHLLTQLGGRAAVRSSAVGEDARDASFAGQHLTVLNVTSTSALIDAIQEVRQSAHSSAALSYRARMGIDGPPRIAVVIQRLIHADAAGVLFTRNPTTGAEERLIEAAWGLGEIVVSGAVVPDSYRLSPAGHLLEKSIGEKDVALSISSDGGVTEVAVEPSRVHAAVLTDSELTALHHLSLRCEELFGKGLDLEWAFEAGTLYLLQCRSITRAGV